MKTAIYIVLGILALAGVYFVYRWYTKKKDEKTVAGVGQKAADALSNVTLGGMSDKTFSRSGSEARFTNPFSGSFAK